MINIGILSHPFAPNADGRVDLVLRNLSDPKTISVPLYRHHEISETPCGIVHVEFTPICKIGEQNVCFVAGQILTEHPLPKGQGLSISAPLLESIEEFDLVGTPIEISLVDRPSVPHCRIYDVDELMTTITGLYMGATVLMDRLALIG